MAKDILWFHAILWPAMLIAGGLRPPREVFAHGFFTINGQRMSKTLGNVIAPADLVERFGADAARYLLLTEFPFGADGDVNLNSFTARYNAELANDLGNLLNRTVSMINRYRGGEVPAAGPEQPLDRELRTLAAALHGEVEREIGELAFVGATDAIRAVVTRANRYVEETAPWKLARSDQDRLSTVLYVLAETERLIAGELAPFMPSAASRMLSQLGAVEKLAPTWGALAAGSRVASQPTPLFPRIEAGVPAPR
jgi:methionyl-tRNA synthetase